MNTKLLKGNKGLLDEERFKKMEKEKIKEIRSLSLEKNIKIMEKLLSSNIINELKNNFLDDNPICLKMILKKHK